jgi:ISXO2-like transposase domain
LPNLRFPNEQTKAANSPRVCKVPQAIRSGEETMSRSTMDGLFFKQERVNHSAGEYVRGMATTNGIESVWAVLKRGLHGVYHQVSKKHLRRYVDEFTFRLNDGNVARHTLQRLDSFVDAVAGKRLTYERLTA